MLRHVASDEQYRTRCPVGDDVGNRAEQHGAQAGFPRRPDDEQVVAALFRDAGLTPSEALRVRGTDAEEAGLTTADDDTILAAMVDNPAYVNRPFVETEKGVRFCRPQDKVREIL